MPSLDRLTRLARRAVGVPAAMVSLVDADRQVFVSASGPAGARESPLSHAFCRAVVDADAPLVVPDGRLFLDGMSTNVTERRLLDEHREELLAEQRQQMERLRELSNAVKYTPAGGTVTVAASRSPDGTAAISVSDTGIGIPAEQYQQLFTRFFRASTALAHGIKGTGLGLAVTKAIVDAHHGTITAAPAEPTGTTFTVTLPEVIGV